jgi:hypothetical protein
MNLQSIARAAIAALVCSVLILWSWQALAASPPLVDLVEAQARRLQSGKEPSVDARQLAELVTAETKSREWIALILTIAHHESALAQRIADGQCKPHECDGGRAWGLWQAHQNKLNAHVWGSTDVAVQLLEARRSLRRAFYLCKRSALDPDWVARTINGYAGRKCDAEWKGLDERLTTFHRVRSRL